MGFSQSTPTIPGPEGCPARFGGVGRFYVVGTKSNFMQIQISPFLCPSDISEQYNPQILINPTSNGES